MRVPKKYAAGLAIAAAFALPMFAATGAQAVVLPPAPSVPPSDVFSCVFTGTTGTLSPAIKSVATDLADGNTGDSLGGAIDPLTDSDNGSGGLQPVGGLGSLPYLLDASFLPGSANNDGTYKFSTANSPLGAANPSACIQVSDVESPGELLAGEVGVYPIDITSEGDYENIVCGTGGATSQGTNTTVKEATGRTVPAVPAAGGFEGIKSVDYTINFVAGQGALVISDLKTDEGADSDTSGGGAGVVNLIPTKSNPPGPLQGGTAVPCVTGDVTEFTASGTFTGYANGS
ncbi:MAG: hypothetical protein QOJ38_955 [Solirubrobacterales bacterium]|jgi:hypothetical protein|nr:hypothetical protein [Solirubrobacterales bacterium]